MELNTGLIHSNDTFPRNVSFTEYKDHNDKKINNRTKTHYSRIEVIFIVMMISFIFLDIIILILLLEINNGITQFSNAFTNLENTIAQALNKLV